MVGFEKALRAVKVIKDQIQYRSQSLLNLAPVATLEGSLFLLLSLRNPITSNLHNAKVQCKYKVILTVKLSRTGFLFACGRLK